MTKNEKLAAETLGDRIKAKRETEGLSLRDLESVVGVSFSSISRAERNKGELTPDHALRLKAWLGDDVEVPAYKSKEAHRAQTLGRMAANAFRSEIDAMLKSALTQAEQPARTQPDAQPAVVGEIGIHQVADQYRAVAHLARSIASVHAQIEPIIRSGISRELDEMRGARSARYMEVLGNILNEMDANDPSEDSWMDVVFKQAQKAYPAVLASSEAREGVNYTEVREKVREVTHRFKGDPDEAATEVMEVLEAMGLLFQPRADDGVDALTKKAFDIAMQETTSPEAQDIIEDLTKALAALTGDTQ